MCQNATKNVAALMAELEPSIMSLINIVPGLANSPEANAAIAAYNKALTAVQNWTPGTAAEIALEAIKAFQDAFNAVINIIPVNIPGLPLPLGPLVNIVLGGIETVISILTGGEPVPAPPAGASPEAVADAQRMHEAVAMHEGMLKVQALTPDFKMSRWHTPQVQYRNYWNKKIDDGKYPVSMKIA